MTSNDLGSPLFFDVCSCPRTDNCNTVMFTWINAILNLWNLFRFQSLDLRALPTMTPKRYYTFKLNFVQIGSHPTSFSPFSYIFFSSWNNFLQYGTRPTFSFLIPLMPNGAFNICCPRDCVSRHNGGTSGDPLKPLRVDSALKALSTLRGLRGAPEVPPLCRETQSLGQQMTNW